MKRTIKAGIILVLIAFLTNLMIVVSAGGYWSESGAAMEDANINTNFGDWEYFYHEPFTNRTSNSFGFQYERDEGVRISSTGRIIGQGHGGGGNNIEGRSVLLAPIFKVDHWEITKYFQMEFPRGLGGFSFDYKNVGDIGKKLFIEVKGEDTEEELFSKEILFDDKNVVHNIRYDFNVDSSNKKVTLTLTTEANAEVVIDDIKWSDHNIKVEFLDGYNNNNELTEPKYIRYGRTLEEFEEELTNIKPGYELIGWYTNPNLSEESKYDLKAPVRKSIKLYSNWQIIYYDIAYDLNGGYFEPFENRDEMIVGFLKDFYNYLDDNSLLTGTDFHQWLMAEGFANKNGTISIDDFIYGTGFNATNPKTGKYGGIYDGLFTKGFVPIEPEVDEMFTISFDLNGGIFENTGTSAYANRDAMITDFLTDFYNFLSPSGITLDHFMHGRGKTSGFDGIYNQEEYFKKLYDLNNKSIDPSTGKFVNQPEYNKWVLLLDLIDQYVNTVNSSQSFWKSYFEGKSRFKPFIDKRTYGNQTAAGLVNKIPKGIRRGGTPQTIPTEYEGGTVITLPTPTRYDGKGSFKGWYEYNYKTKKFVGPIQEITSATLGNKDYYALWNGVNNPTPKPETSLGIKLRKDSYFNQLYEMSALYTDETETEYNKDFSDLNRILEVDPSRPYFINQPEYNKWQHLLQLIHEYTILGNEAQWFGIWKSYYTGAIRMEMFFQQYNPWPSQESEERFIVFEMLRRVPYNIPKVSVPYRYTIEDELIPLPIPIKEHVDDEAAYAGWYENPEFTGDVVDEIPAGSTGDKKYYARFAEKKFAIDYNLNGGKFAPYTNRDEMINDFLDDFYDFVEERLNGELKDSRNKFKHGTDKTSGFNGTYSEYIYYSDKKTFPPLQLLFATDDKSINPRTGRFINQENHNNRWLPLLELAADFTKAIDSKDDFWKTPKLAAERLKQLFTKSKPPLAPGSVDTYFSKIPTNISKVEVPKYFVNDTVTELPEAVRDGMRFIGWYNTEDFTENAWEVIPKNTSKDVILHAKWYIEGSFEVIYDFGEYGYHGTTRTDYFRWFISDYIDEFNLDITEEALYDDFFNNSRIQEAAGLKDFEELFTYLDGRWAWVENYILRIVGENYEYYDELKDYNQVIWRLNIDALFNNTQTSFLEMVEEEEITVSSGDFSSIENANGFWKDTPYNKYETQIIPGGDLFPEEFVEGWHPGYKFTGWHLLDGTKLTKFPEDPKRNLTLKAKWEDVFNGDVIVIFLDHDDTMIATKEVPSDGFLIEMPEEPERAHYKFIGWYDGVTQVDFTQKITQSLIVKAKYENETYTLTFATDGGTEIIPQELVYPDLPERPVDPEKDGFTFAGWFKDVNYSEVFFFEFPLYEDTIIYAKWDPITYNINYHLNGGEFVTNNGTNPETYTILDVITLSLATKENHQFIGWYLNADFSGDVITVIENMIGDLDLYAKFELNTYLVELDPNNGDPLTVLTVTHGQTVPKPADPVKEGCTFDVWSFNDLVFNFTTPITEDMTIIALYNELYFKVIYKNHDGSELSNQDIAYGQYANVPLVPTREGYTGSWEVDLRNVEIKQNYNIKPIYKAIEYTIFYHLDGGTNSPNNPQTYNKDQEITLDKAIKDGYQFLGWYFDMDLTNEITTIKNMSGNLNLYAKFALKEYDITYLNIEGATHTNPITYNIYDVIILEDAFKDGYFFRGWYLDAAFTNEIEIIENRFEDLTIYANFSNLIDYNISYILYPNSVEPNDPAIFNQTIYTYNTDQTVTLDEPTDRTSSEFKGWYDNDTFTGTAVTKINKGSTGDKTFYAKWELKKYTISLYDSKQAILGNSDPREKISDIPHSSIISIEDYNGTITDGYEFIGWHYLMPDNNTSVLFDQEQQINASYKLYPEFGLKQYKVTFIVDSTTNYQYLVYHNELLPNIPEDPIIAGNEFIGWYLEDGITIFNENAPITSDLTIVARWSNYNFFKVTFLNEDGSLINVISVYDGSQVAKPESNPEKTGSSFSGWFLNGAKFDFETQINENITLRAKFALNSYTITFNSNEGSVVEPITALYGSGITAPPAPTKDGNLFIDWYRDETLTIPYTFKTMPAENITLYAKWSLNQYQVRFFDYDNTLLDTKVVDYGATVEAPTTIPAREHYLHDGWDKLLTNITKNTDIKAVYKGKTYTVTFNSNGGTNVSSQFVTYPNRALKPIDPTKEDFIFAGWHNGLDTSEFNFNSIITSDITISAKWTSANVTVTFDYGYKKETVSIIKGNSVTKPIDPARSGYKFDGWYFEDSLFSFDEIINEDKTLVAKYTQILTVNYLKENDETLRTFEVLYGKIIPVSEIPGINEVQNPGYTVAWDKDLTNYIITEDLDVRPVYTAIEYTITYSNVLPGATNPNKTKYKITDEDYLLENPSNPLGNQFTGWYLDGVKIDKIIKGSFGNIVITAKWNLVDYAITYHLNGGQFFGFNDRDAMITNLLTEFHGFLNLSISLNDFMHGAGKSSGYDGSYADHIELLREINDKTINPETNKFVNQAEYNKWVPLIDLMDEYTGINPEQAGHFWGSNWTAGLRFKPFIQKLNIWQNDNKEAEVAEIVNKIPNEYNYSVSYQYNLESGTVNLPTPMKDNHEFIGWYTANTGGTKVTAITEGTTGNQTFYARWNIAQYSINYNLHGGVFSNHNTKEDMIHAFLQDLYDFVNATEDLNTFMHGTGKTSGFNGTWYSNTAYKDKIYKVGRPTSVNEAYFASSSKYKDKWLPFFDMMERFVKVNPNQSFWGSVWTGTMRLSQYIRNVKPGSDWTNNDLEMMPNTLIPITVPRSYQAGNREIILPIPSRSNYYFEGWYTNINHTGNKVTRIPKNSTSDKTYYAKWQIIIDSGNFTKRILTGSACYQKNINKEPGFPRTIHKGVIIHSVGYAGATANSLYNTWNTSSSGIALHALVDDKKIYQYLEWDYRAYHTANAGNEKYVGIMIIENSGYSYSGNTIVGYNVSQQEPYFNAAWNNAVNLTVHILKNYRITEVNETTVVGRHDAYPSLAITPVSSPGLLFEQHNKTMSDFRADVRARL